jgi:hypothetical protein
MVLVGLAVFRHTISPSYKAPAKTGISREPPIFRDLFFLISPKIKFPTSTQQKKNQKIGDCDLESHQTTGH